MKSFVKQLGAVWIQFVYGIAYLKRIKHRTFTKNISIFK